MDITIQPPPKRGPGRFWSVIVLLTYAFAAVAGAAMLGMAVLTCLDVILRAFGRPFTGVYDIVRILAVIAVAGALPLTTAAKGHVAIEFFFDKFNPRVRLAIDSLMRLLMIFALACAAFGLWRYGGQLRAVGEVSSTLEIPVFWTFWVLAVSCGLTAFTVLFHLVKPGKEMVTP